MGHSRDRWLHVETRETMETGRQGDTGRQRATWGDIWRYRETVQTGGDRGRRVKQGEIEGNIGRQGRQM